MINLILFVLILISYFVYRVKRVQAVIQKYLDQTPESEIDLLGDSYCELVLNEVSDLGSLLGSWVAAFAEVLYLRSNS
jgi:hypothetical protein